MKKRESEFAERTKNANALRDRATDINKELADLKAQHDKAFEELNALKEQAGLRVPEEPEMNNTSKFEVTAIPSRSVFGQMKPVCQVSYNNKLPEAPTGEPLPM